MDTESFRVDKRQKFLLDIEAVKHLALKLHQHTKKLQDQYLIASRLHTSANTDEFKDGFGRIRMIEYCALCDVQNFQKSIERKRYIAVKNLMNEDFGESLMIEALGNYIIFNFIVRFYSIVEAACKYAITGEEYKKYSSKLSKNEGQAWTVLQSWRNCIHMNGVADKDEEKQYRKYQVQLSKTEPFQFTFWLLYRVSKDVLDAFYHLALMKLEMK